MKKWFIILIVFKLLNPYVCYSKQREMADSLSHLAYSKTNHDSAMLIFKKAQKFLKNDTQRANFFFYKYFYFLKNNYKDSAEKIQYLTLNSLNKAKKLDNLEWIFTTTYWVYVGESQYDKALKLCKLFQKFTFENKDTTNQIYVLNKFSNIYHDLSNYSLGIEYGQQALLLSKKFRNNNLIVASLVMIAMNYDDWEKHEEAINYYYKIFKISLSPDFDYSQIYNNIGNSYLKLNQLDSALKYVNLAYEIDKKHGNRNYELATCINNLGHIFIKKKEFNKAKIYLDSAYYYSKLSNNHEKLRDVNYTLYLYHKQVGNFEKSLEHLTNYHNYKDSMLDVKRLAIIQNLENKARESEYQNQLLTLENKTKVRNLWIVVFSALLFIALLIIRQIYLKRLRIAKEAEINIQNERLRISRDLHDNIGTELTYITSFVEQQTFKIKDEQIKNEIEKIGESSRLAMSQMRETIWAIQNKDISIEDLIFKIKSLLEKYTKPHGISLKIDFTGKNIYLKPAYIICLIRVCQEATNNSIKYSKCKNIEIQFLKIDKSLNININDDGYGFDIESTKNGNGLNNMKERVEELNGNFSINSGKTGTEIIINIPIEI